MKFSVLLPVHDKVSPQHLVECLSSLEAQTRPAEEILMVKDGLLGPALETVIKSYMARLPINTLQLAENKGIGGALRAGVERCHFDVIARMDADDICAAERFARQVCFLEAHPEVDVLSGTIREFHSDPSVSVCERRLPTEHATIMAFAKRRNPMNHMAVVFRRAAVLAAGNYPAQPYFEDYALWVRMLMNKSRFHNLENVCTFARCGNGMQQRRGGWNYVRQEALLFWNFRSWGFLSTWEALGSAGLRLPARLLPCAWRSLFYRIFVRQPLGKT